MRSEYALGFNSLEEEVGPISLQLQGQIPEWLQGKLLRTGPAKFEVGDDAFRHWFDGLGMLYKLDFAGGHVSYSNRFLRGETFNDSMAKNKIRRDGFATSRNRRWWEKLSITNTPKAGDNCNVNISQVAGEFVALTETPTPLQFDSESLQTVGAFHFAEKLKGQISTAHPHYDARRRRLYNYLLELGPRCYYHLYSIADGSSRQELVASIPVSNPAYMHSFAMTERYLVLTEFPLVSQSLRFVFGRQPFIEKYQWEPERGTIFRVVDKETGELLKSAQAESFFAFHHANAFERNGELCIDVAAYADASVLDQLYLNTMRSAASHPPAGELRRYRLNLSGSDDVKGELLSDAGLEFPRIDYQRDAGRDYQTLFAGGSHPQGQFIDSLLKLDLQNDSTRRWHEAACYPGEAVHVAAADGKQAVVLSVVLDTKREKSFLLVLDAGSFSEIARAELPHAVPFGFHGNFYR